MALLIEALSIILFNCFISQVNSYHKTNQNQAVGQMKPLPRGVFRPGPPPTRGSFNHGRVMIFTNPPPRVTPPSLHIQPVTPPPTTPRPPLAPPTTQMVTTTKAFDWNSYFATTYPSTKKGRCPNFDAVHAECYGRCHKDDDCFYERKCCRDGYGFGCCVDPVQPGIFDDFFTGFFGGHTTAAATGGFFGGHTTGATTGGSFGGHTTAGLFGGGPTTSSYYWKK